MQPYSSSSSPEPSPHLPAGGIPAQPAQQAASSQLNLAVDVRSLTPVSDSEMDYETPICEKSPLPEGSKQPIHWTDQTAYIGGQSYAIKLVSKRCFINFYLFNQGGEIAYKDNTGADVKLQSHQWGIKVRNDMPIGKKELALEDQFYAELSSQKMRDLGFFVPKRVVFETQGNDKEPTRFELVELLDTRKAISISRDNKVFEYAKKMLTLMAEEKIPVIPDFNASNVLYDLQGHNLYFIDWSSPAYEDIKTSNSFAKFHFSTLINQWATIKDKPTDINEELFKRLTADFPAATKPYYDTEHKVGYFAWDKKMEE